MRPAWKDGEAAIATAAIAAVCLAFPRGCRPAPAVPRGGSRSPHGAGRPRRERET
jgi:hypothetical protein